MKFIINMFSVCLSVCILSAMQEKSNQQSSLPEDSNSSGYFGRIQPNALPNPMNDRAKGYLLKGKVQSAITNYGNFINWDHHPAGLWGEYTYLPTTAFMAGVPGHSYSYKYNWFQNVSDSDCPEAYGNYSVWCSSEAYSDPGNTVSGFSWIENNDTNYVSVVFETQLDDGVLGEKLYSPYELSIPTCTYENTNKQWSDYWSNNACTPDPQIENEIECCSLSGGVWQEPSVLYYSCDFSEINQWCLDDEKGFLIVSLPLSDDYNIDPNNANVYGDVSNKRGMGLAYPWAVRPALNKRKSFNTYDIYKYGNDQEEWTDDDDYDYYGFNVAESHFTRWNPSSNADWQATPRARENTHNTIVDESDIFGNINYLDIASYPLLAHSGESDTWPDIFNEETGAFEKQWPGWWAENFNPEGTECNPPFRYNDECWETVPGRFISDMDVYMEFDDRWAHRGNTISNNQYQQTGYPMGFKVMAAAHSYGVAFAEDIMFVTVQVRNESGDWCAFERNERGEKIDVLDENGNQICGEAMTLPDGTKINRGKGFDYKDVFMGFNMDADVVTATKFGGMGVHTNPDDFMEYYDCKNPDIVPEGCEVINDDTLRVSIAMIYDYDGVSGSATDIGIVATQLLDSPYASEPVDLNGDGYADIFPGDKLKMTNWHWYSWYGRPGVIYYEGDAGCCAGDPGAGQARQKEEIMYKIISGDTTNLSLNERNWYFHTNAPSTDDHENNLNPRFDSLEGLELTEFFQEDPDGLDCVLEMSSGPFSLEVGEQVPFSFCIIFGENKNDLIENATFAQLMYNSHYQGYTAPDTPKLIATTGDSNLNEDWYDGQHHYIKLSWDNSSESTSDVVTGYSDFEGYKLYRSRDGGLTWGDPNTDKLYDQNGAVAGWKPYAQFHLTAEQDSLHCTFANDYHGECTISKPEFYVERGCFETDIENGEENPADCWQGDCTDSAWVDCVRDNCARKTNEEYLSLPDILKIAYVPFYSEVVDCNDPKWGGDGVGEPEIRGFNVCGEDEKVPYMGVDALGDCNDNAGLQYTFIDSQVVDGYEYTYSLTAYDMGITPPVDIDFDIINEDGSGILNSTPNSANPLSFAKPDGYEFIECGRGTTVNDDNFITITAGDSPDQNLECGVGVVPNPYIDNGLFNETAYLKRLRFTHLPEKCTISIFTISGEKVITLDHDVSTDSGIGDDVDGGNHWWNLRTMNNQEVAPGLYIYVVESEDRFDKCIGKFAIVR